MQDFIVIHMGVGKNKACRNKPASDKKVKLSL
jgi:hypothetical protein